MNSLPVPPATLRALAALALLLGLACAVVNGWFFALGLDRLEPDATARAPLAGQQRLQALESELAGLKGSIHPTLTGVLGESGATALAAARALLIGVMGLVLMSAAGQLWAASRSNAASSGARPASESHRAPRPTHQPTKSPTPSAQELASRSPTSASSTGPASSGRNWPPWQRRSGQIPPKRPPPLAPHPINSEASTP